MKRVYLLFCVQLLIIFVLAGNLSAHETDSRFSDADFQRHVKKLKSKLPGNDFHVVIQKPFVVIGDDKRPKVEQWARGTVKWTVDRIKKQYFTKDPNQIIDIWLFKDKASYEKNCEKIVGYKPHTPFGFYSSSRRAIIMNISTGGGTLVHEIVHPFVESNFSKCPSWFNEGLASLYEQCRDKDGVIWGSTNWRLRPLQLEIESNTLGSTSKLCATTTDEFYNSSRGNNYGQARYLCYYLQEKGLLKKYYHAFRDNVGKDPTGFETLKSVLDETDMAEFDTRWRKYCLGLKFQ